jgi:hypothetical protein
MAIKLHVTIALAIALLPGTISLYNNLRGTIILLFFPNKFTMGHSPSMAATCPGALTVHASLVQKLDTPRSKG